MTGQLRVAVAQARAVLGDVEANVATAVSAVREAGSADVLVLPELFLTGYSCGPLEPLSADDPRLTPLVEAARSARVRVFVGAPLAGPTISLLDVADESRRAYDKVHLSGSEKEHFVPGGRPAVFDVGGWPVGLGICYDGCFPEHGRRLAKAGAQAALYAVAYFAGSEHRRDLYYRARALDNSMYVAVSGLIGPCGEAEFCGGSAIYDPEGREVARVPEGQEGVAIADLDPDLVAATRAAHPMLAEA